MKALLTLTLAAASLIPAHAQSLWVNEANNEQSMYADARARNVGDILTVIVDENVTSSLAQELKTNDGAQSGFGVFVSGLLNQFLKASPAILSQLTGANLTQFPDDSPVDIPTLDLAAKNQWTGGGQTTNRLAVNSRTAVTVVDVLPNGNLVIEGAKIIRVNKENLYGYMRGVVRQKDVSRDNTVLSSAIADAQVEFIPEGELTEAERKGWMLRAWERIKPF